MPLHKSTNWGLYRFVLIFNLGSSFPTQFDKCRETQTKLLLTAAVLLYCGGVMWGFDIIHSSLNGSKVYCNLRLPGDILPAGEEEGGRGKSYCMTKYASRVSVWAPIPSKFGWSHARMKSHKDRIIPPDFRGGFQTLAYQNWQLHIILCFSFITVWWNRLVFTIFHLSVRASKFTWCPKLACLLYMQAITLSGAGTSLGWGPWLRRLMWESTINWVIGHHSVYTESSDTTQYILSHRTSLGIYWVIGHHSVWENHHPIDWAVA